MIRVLTVDDLPAAAEMGQLFIDESGLRSGFDPAVFVAKWTTLIEADLGFMIGLIRDNRIVGAFGAIVAENLNDGKLEANECFWFVRPEARGRGLELLAEYEREAKRRGAVRCSMIHLLSLQPERLGDLYQRRGYIPVETSYFKELV